MFRLVHLKKYLEPVLFLHISFRNLVFIWSSTLCFYSFHQFAKGQLIGKDPDAEKD